MRTPIVASDKRRRVPVHRFVPAEWTPVAVSHHFKRAIPGENYPTGMAADAALLVAGDMLHVETEFRCTRVQVAAAVDRSPVGRSRSWSLSYSGSASPPPVGAEEGGESGGNAYAPAAPTVGAAEVVASTSPGEDPTDPYHTLGTDDESDAQVSRPGASLTVVVSAVRGDVIRPIFKTQRNPREWVSVVPRMTPADMRTCYEVQTDALGLPYSDAAQRNLTLRFIGCGCMTSRPQGGDTDGLFCSELVAASLRGTAYELDGVVPWMVSPSDIYEALVARCGGSIRAV